MCYLLRRSTLLSVEKKLSATVRVCDFAGGSLKSRDRIKPQLYRLCSPYPLLYRLASYNTSSWLVLTELKKAIDPQVEVKKWRRELTKEMRNMGREIRKIEEAKKKSVVECQKLGKAGRLDACKILAKV